MNFSASYAQSINIVASPINICPEALPITFTASSNTTDSIQFSGSINIACVYWLEISIPGITELKCLDCVLDVSAASQTVGLLQLRDTIGNWLWITAN